MASGPPCPAQARVTYGPSIGVLASDLLPPRDLPPGVEEPLRSRSGRLATDDPGFQIPGDLVVRGWENPWKDGQLPLLSRWQVGVRVGRKGSVAKFSAGVGEVDSSPCGKGAEGHGCPCIVSRSAIPTLQVSGMPFVLRTSHHRGRDRTPSSGDPLPVPGDPWHGLGEAPPPGGRGPKRPGCRPLAEVMSSNSSLSRPELLSGAGNR